MIPLGPSIFSVSQDNRQDQPVGLVRFIFSGPGSLTAILITVLSPLGACTLG